MREYRETSLRIVPELNTILHAMCQSRIHITELTNTRSVRATFFLPNVADPNRIAKYCKIICLEIPMLDFCTLL
jgi:hypothetical protein